MLVDFYFAQKTFFPKNLLPNSGCGLSTDAAYTRVNTVYSRCVEAGHRVIFVFVRQCPVLKDPQARKVR